MIDLKLRQRPQLEICTPPLYRQFPPHTVISVMHLSVLLSVFAIAASASPFPALLHDKPHHTHEVLVNLHKTPHCAYGCIFHETYPMKFAPECVPLQDEPEKGEEYGSCLCRANGFQFMLDKCVEAKCSPKERKEVLAALGVCLI